MFKLIESVGEGFIRLPKLDDRPIKTGMVVQLVDFDNNLYCKLCDGNRPFGIMGGRKDNFLKIYIQHMIFRTSYCEEDFEYKSGAPLYVSENGLLTTNKAGENHLIVGHVISDYRDERGYLEVNWI